MDCVVLTARSGAIVLVDIVDYEDSIATFRTGPISACLPLSGVLCARRNCSLYEIIYVFTCLFLLVNQLCQTDRMSTVLSIVPC